MEHIEMKCMDNGKLNAICNSGNTNKSAINRRLKSNLMLVVLMLAMGTVAMNAQAQKGDFMLGSDLGSGLIGTGSSGLFGFDLGLNEGAGFNLGISPKAGYFLNNNIVVGAVVNLGFIKSPETNGQAAETTVYGVQGLLRYYVRPSQFEVDDLPKRGLFFLESNAGVAGFNVSGGNSTNGFAFGVGPGYALFVSDNVALELTGKYNGLVGGGNTTYQHSLGLNLGVQVFLSKERAKNVIKNRN